MKTIITAWPYEQDRQGRPSILFEPVWEHVGEAGDHIGHHLHADAMQDVHCLECDSILSDDEEAEAWPTEN
jgi:hypothetical protein